MAAAPGGLGGGDRRARERVTIAWWDVRNWTTSGGLAETSIPAHVNAWAILQLSKLLSRSFEDPTQRVILDCTDTRDAR